MKILLIYPTVFEAKAFYKKYFPKKKFAVGSAENFKSGGVDFVSLVSGYGGKAALERVQNLKDKENPDLAVVCGFCGACDPKINKCAYLYQTKNPDLEKVFASFGAKPAFIACADGFANLEEKLAFFKDGYSAVDMEGDRFKPIFGDDKFGAFRCVSDELKSNAPEEFFKLLMDTQTGADRPIIPVLAKLFFKNPVQIWRLIQFGNASKAMMKEYNQNALKLIEQLTEAFGS